MKVYCYLCRVLKEDKDFNKINGHNLCVECLSTDDVKLKISWLKEYKQKCHCKRCKENHPACLDFHHINGDKKGNISQMVRSPCNLQVIIEEIEKCIILCANCHRKEHFETEDR